MCDGRFLSIGISPECVMPVYILRTADLRFGLALRTGWQDHLFAQKRNRGHVARKFGGALANDVGWLSKVRLPGVCFRCCGLLLWVLWVVGCC